MREKEIEQFLVKEIKKRGGQAWKLYVQGKNGVPDRLILLPDGKISFIELKAPGKKMRPLQIKRKNQLEMLGFSVYCIDGIEQIGGIIDEIENA